MPALAPALGPWSPPLSEVDESAVELDEGTPRVDDSSLSPRVVLRDIEGSAVALAMTESTEVSVLDSRITVGMDDFSVRSLVVVGCFFSSAEVVLGSGFDVGVEAGGGGLCVGVSLA